MLLFVASESSFLLDFARGKASPTSLIWKNELTTKETPEAVKEV